jgi:hypothetical protein
VRQEEVGLLAEPRDVAVGPDDERLLFLAHGTTIGA